LKQYDLDVSRMRLVNNETNCTFRLDTADGRRYTLRISQPLFRSFGETVAEIAWLEALTRETDIPIARPIPTRDGEYIVRAEATGVPEPRCCVVFEWLRGRPLAERATAENFRSVGRLAALLHRHGAGYTPPKPASIRRIDSLYPLGGREMLLEDSTRALLSDEGYERLLEMRAAVERELDWLFGRGEAPQILHGDFHWWNVLVHRETVQPIDFEDLCWGYPVQDIAISAYYTAPGTHAEAYRLAFREGYEEVAAWPELYPGQIELHMVHRALDLFNFVLGTSYREDRELLEHFLDRIQGHHWRTYKHWKASFDERFYR
jgi:Ser/Thr protein kinase RdoA (MazF antagonist)